ncbi:MAG: hypothetical protein QCI00_03155 [Candidatus Thermoplasmatota archaeon]|nr:hypothetical protein [Candidatus Thermoplasmatota archaeon]
MESSLIEGLKSRIQAAVGSYQSVGILLRSNNYNDLTHALFDNIACNPERLWIYVTITKPFLLLKRQFNQVIDNNSIFFIDCVSRAAGIQTNDEHCYFLDSPSQLEQLILVIVNNVKKAGEDQQPIVILDALSTLILYNDGLLVTEFFNHLLNNLYLYNTHTISLCLEEEMNDYMNKMLYLRNEKIIKLKESFI